MDRNHSLAFSLCQRLFRLEIASQVKSTLPAIVSLESEQAEKMIAHESNSMVPIGLQRQAIKLSQIFEQLSLY